MLLINETQQKILSDFMGNQYTTSVDYNNLIPITRKINSLGKGTQFAIFKTYVSCTVEKSGKFHKDFSFSHAEYITDDITDLEAIFKLVLKFILWYNQNNF